MPPKKWSSRHSKHSDDESLNDSLEEETEQTEEMEVEDASIKVDTEGNRPAEDLGKPESSSKSPENPHFEDKIENMRLHQVNGQNLARSSSLGPKKRNCPQIQISILV
eukprot:GFUD01088404.1.p1 GENE.GFUD01088404.1~~GFUD01088404.1.p1  ORF type:complete len:108 (-),score=26.76 GFUD01088404.1:6-329(-)